MRAIQTEWNYSVFHSFNSMYDNFDELNVEIAVCLGDFFDKAVLEAKSVSLVTSILDMINQRTFPTYFLLGNHEVDSREHNILDFLREYENIIPVTDLSRVEDFVFVPYTTEISSENLVGIEGKYVFTHHDFYGVELANGKVRASFGCDPNEVASAKRVFNGHVHLSSNLGNIINVGSLLKSQQGELRLGTYPTYLVLDTAIDKIAKYNNENSIMYLSLRPEEVPSLSCYPEGTKFVLNIDYKGSDAEVDTSEFNILKLNYRKRIEDSLESDEIIKKSNIDIKEVLTTYINKDQDIDDETKKRRIDLGIKLLGVSV